MKIRTLLATATTAAVLATGGVAIAGAADGAPEGSGPARPERTGERLGHRGGARAHMAGGSLRIAADTIGVEPKELLDAVKEGKTVAAVATEHDVEPQAVIDAIVAKANERIDKLATEKDLDAERVTQMKERAATAAAHFVNETSVPERGFHKRGGRGPMGRMGHGVLETAAEAIGIEPEALAQELRDGKTVAEVAEANDVDPQTVVDAIVKAGTERLEQMADKFVNETKLPGHGPADGEGSGSTADPSTLDS